MGVRDYRFGQSMCLIGVVLVSYTKICGCLIWFDTHPCVHPLSRQACHFLIVLLLCLYVEEMKE